MNAQIDTATDTIPSESMSLKRFAPFTFLAAVLASVLLAASPAVVCAQSANFAGIQTTVPVSGLAIPTGLALDAAGDLFIVDTDNHRVVEVPAGGGAQITVPISGLSLPFAAAVDAAGDLFVADQLGNRVVELPAGSSTPVTVPVTGLSSPCGVAVDAAGDLFIADTGNHRVVELPAGSSTPVTVPVTGLDEPTNVTVDAAGDLFIPDVNNTVVELPAGGSVQVTVPVTGLDGPTSVAVDAAGDLFISDINNHRVVELPTGGGSQITIPLTGSVDPGSVVVNAAGDLFITSEAASKVLEINRAAVPFGKVSICATPASCGETMTLNYNVSAGGNLGTPKVVTQGAPNLDFTLASGGTCTGAVTAGSSCTVNVTLAPKFSGLREGAVQLTDQAGNVLATTLVYGIGQGPQIAFGGGAQITVPAGALGGPSGVAVDGAGDVFIADAFNNLALKVPAGGGSPTLVGSGLNAPQSMAVDGAGNLFIADSANGRVVEVPAGGGPQTTVPASGLEQPFGVAVDGAGDIFIADAAGFVVEVPAGGGPQITIPANGLTLPQDVAVDAAGDVFITDPFNARVLEVPAGGGAQFTVGSGWIFPIAVAVDGAGNLFVADLEQHAVVEVPAGGGPQFTLGSGFDGLSGVAVDGAGNVFAVNEAPQPDNNRVVELQRALPPTLSFAATNTGSTSSDSPQSVTLQNIGNQPLNAVAPGLSVGANFIQAPGSGTPADCTSSFSLTPGAVCNLSISFVPEAAGSIQSAAVLTDNATPATQSITLTGTGQSTAPTLAFIPIPNQTYGAAPFAVSATSKSSGAITYSVVSGPATIFGDVVTLTGTGTVTLQASQAASGAYSAATVQTSFTVATAAPANITVNNGNNSLNFGVFPFGLTGTNQITFGVSINNNTANTTQITAAFANSPANYSVINNGCSSPHSGYSSYCQITIGFAQPASLAGLAQTYNATLVLTSSNPAFGFVGGGKVTVTAGEAKVYTTAPYGTSPSAPVNFGSANNGSTGQSINFQIFNPSGWNGSGAPASTSLSNWNNWNFTGNCNGYLSDKSSCTATLQFKGSYPPGQTNTGTMTIGGSSGVRVWNADGSAVFGTLYLTGKTN